MIDHYQPYLFPFLGSRASYPNPLVKRYYYWSWEDGLWDLLRGKHVEKGSTILIPDFYCSDVINNIRTHGYTVVLYRLDQHFQVKKQTLLNSIRRHNPSVVIVFHVCGVKSTVMTKPTWMKKSAKETIIVEDSVHQLLTPSLVKPLSDNHFIMDSLRKVSPLYGSFLYGTKKGLHFHQTNKTWSFYTMYSLLLYGLFRIVLTAGHVFNQPSLAVFAHEKLLKFHDNVIGDSMRSYRGCTLFSWMTQWIYTTRVERIKREQVKMYEHTFKSLWGRRSPLYRIQMKRSDYGKLHVYPVGLRQKTSVELLSYLRSKKIIVWPKFSDSVWAKKRDVLFFPLGFHMNKQKIKVIAKALVSWKTGAWKQEKTTVKNPSPHLLVRAAEVILSF
ncbi:MAG: aminotransferase class I/II-fold pyridoxal phosphate-dependent enzyme [Candidatus Gottesmanbacteria bacterium]